MNYPIRTFSPAIFIRKPYRPGSHPPVGVQGPGDCFLKVFLLAHLWCGKPRLLDRVALLREDMTRKNGRTARGTDWEIGRQESRATRTVGPEDPERNGIVPDSPHPASPSVPCIHGSHAPQGVTDLRCQLCIGKAPLPVPLTGPGPVHAGRCP